MSTLYNGIQFVAATTVTGALMLFTPLWGPRIVYAGIPGGSLTGRDRSATTFALSDTGCLFLYVAIANSLLRAIRDDYRLFPTLAYVMPFLCERFRDSGLVYGRSICE